MFRYFHGRSTLATWLRSVLAQRHVDAVRARRRTEPLEAADDRQAVRAAQTDTERQRYLDLMERALTAAVEALGARDRLRLASYYTQGLTLAQVGRLLGEHEATVSRQLARTRREIRRSVEAELRTSYGLIEPQVEQCFACALDDPVRSTSAESSARIPGWIVLYDEHPVTVDRDDSVERLLTRRNPAADPPPENCLESRDHCGVGGRSARSDASRDGRGARRRLCALSACPGRDGSL